MRQILKITLLLAFFALLLSSFFLLLSPISKASNIITGNYNNITVHTSVHISNSKPEVLTVRVYQDNTPAVPNITLNAGSTRNITCNTTIRDWDGYHDIVNVNATIWNVGASQSNALDDNNTHYTNYNCSGPFDGLNYTASYVCTFPVLYYTNNGTWSCNVTAIDTFNKTGWNTNNTFIYSYYALNVTDGLDYGNVAVEDYSLEQNANVTNFGNTAINISFAGYANTIGDGLAMNCSVSGNITIDNERYALASGTWASKIALNSTSQIVGNLTMPKQTNASVQIINGTYWQVYIPPNPAGNCTGFVLLSAQAP